jgi:Cobalamin-independent synthase, Catalytic domain
MTRPWPPGAVTGIGSLPGTDPREAATLVFGELPDLPHVAELPARGPGASMVGRAASLLVELPVELVPTGWRLTAAPGRDQRAARDDLSRDLDALEETAAGYVGPLKLQVAGPWTLAASLELPSGHRLVTDHGATRDLIESLTEGLRTHLADVASRIPGATPVLQLDEPSLPAVLGGRVPTPSGYGTVRSVEPQIVGQALQDVLAVAPAGSRVVHCCAPDVPLGLLRSAGADALSVDAAFLTTADYDQLGEAVEEGVSLWLGVLPTGSAPSLAAARDRLHDIWSELGFNRDQLAASVVPTPACGLAGASPDQVRRTLAVLRDVGASLCDES